MSIWKSFLLSWATVAVFCCIDAPAQVGVLPKKDVSLTDATDDKFRVGNVWEYETRKGEERSRLTILKVDNSPELGVIVHIGVDNVRLSNCRSGPEPEAVPHMPFVRKALEASVKKKGLCTTICKSVRSARVSGNAHFGLVLPSTTTFAPKWAEFRVRCGNDAQWDL